jgi:hypothetical protein
VENTVEKLQKRRVIGMKARCFGLFSRAKSGTPCLARPRDVSSL